MRPIRLDALWPLLQQKKALKYNFQVLNNLKNDQIAPYLARRSMLAAFRALKCHYCIN